VQHRQPEDLPVRWAEGSRVLTITFTDSTVCVIWSFFAKPCAHLQRNWLATVAGLTKHHSNSCLAPTLSCPALISSMMAFKTESFSRYRNDVRQALGIDCDMSLDA
jgi:hypothetical protein